MNWSARSKGLAEHLPNSVNAKFYRHANAELNQINYKSVNVQRLQRRHLSENMVITQSRPQCENNAVKKTWSSGSSPDRATKKNNDNKFKNA